MALISIKNGTLEVILDSVGAVLHSIRMDGNEYMWQGDAKYWKRRDANLFPYVGRLTDGQYIYQGRAYPMTIHGFCIGTEFETERQSDDSVTFLLTANDTTREMYPFEFAFRVQYSLCGSMIVKKCTVENRDSKLMHFGLGGHPGFNVPVCGQGRFEDWYLEFDGECSPKRADLDPDNYRFAGTYSDYPINNGRTIPLRHDLFDLDAVVLSEMSRAVTIKSDLFPHSVKVSYPGMGFLGLWHAPKTDAPYVCIEPWVSLPSHSAYVEDLEKQEHLIALEPGRSYENKMTIEIG